jgi:Ribonuclease G/E
MTICILAACSPGEVRVAAVQSGGLLDYAIWRPGVPDGVGDLYRGRVIAHVPAMAGAFVALNGAEGFLPDSQSGAEVTEGGTLGVRITRAAQGGKGPRLSAKLDPADRALVGAGPPALLRRGPGTVERLARLYPDAPIVVDDPGLAATLRASLGDRVSRAHPAFDEALEAEVEALSHPTVELPGGGRMHIHPTPALVAIDLDTGAAVAQRREKAAAQTEFNLAALRVLARQIRLRNLSGAILVDFAGLSVRRRAALRPDLAAALADDPLRPRLLGFTALGLAEILRPRVHPPLHELLVGAHAVGLAALRRIAADLAARPDRVPVLRATPAIVAALQADPVALPDLARRAGRPLILQSDPTLRSFIVETSDG